MNAIGRLIEKLRKHPELNWSEEGDGVSVDPATPEGFSVWLTPNQGGFTVGFDGWHEHFDDEVAAVNCFAFGFSNQCRLRVAVRGNSANSATSWTLESLDGNVWVQDSSVAMFFVPFWRKRRIEYRQNPVIRLD
jgi:hypothetical protein